ncbi:MAG: vitamin B12-dependent ribonucleotide reductase [Ignavibacteria bacterium]|nr:vitamin B12-dependent ribonucleotide reductase [Ignavibacteria bacterium]
MKFTRVFTKKGESPFDKFQYELRRSEMKNPDGSVVFKMDNVEVPAHWSQVATDILAQKYFRKTQVPLKNKNGIALKDKYGRQKFGSENSIKQVVHRLADTWKDWGLRHGYFDSDEDANIFYDEIVFMLINQMAAPNSPQWFNTGLFHCYGISGSKQGHYYVDPNTEELKHSEDSYSRPQPHACFIQSVKDDLINEGGIFDLALREARIFKFGSGTGTNFSDLRGAKEPLSGGGISSGLMSFLKIFDRAAGAIKSGGTTRRAAKMVIVDVDHPDIEEFIDWKAKEEEKVAALVSGSKTNNLHLKKIADCIISNETNIKENKELRQTIQDAALAGVPANSILRVINLVEQGFTSLDFEEYNTHYEGDAYNTVSGQNSNNSIRVTNEFMKAVENDDVWELRWRTDKSQVKSVRAKELWDKILLNAWKCADPGLQFDTTINEWHTCPNSGRINASNPCSEYMFLDDTACNLASLNLAKFFDEESCTFKIDEFQHSIRIWTVALEISVLMAQFPSKEMAQRSYDFRTLGLGYANLGSLLMISGIPYDSKEAMAIAGAISSLLTSESYKTSAEMASKLGPFSKYEKNKEEMLRVLRNHQNACYNAPEDKFEGLSIKPIGINEDYCPKYLLDAAKKSWDETLKLGKKQGFRNAQVTVLAPTGTIGLVMDCDTTGIEPDFAIVKFKKLAGGGYFKICNQSVSKSLKKLGYTANEIEEIEKYSTGYASLENCSSISYSKLKQKGFGEKQIKQIENELKSAFDIRFAFNKWVLGEQFLKKIGIPASKLNDENFDLLSELGFSKEDIELANDYVCGTMMLEGAPHLKEEHLPIFDTANRCGSKGKRFIHFQAHINMMAAAQPFITGAISKTVNMPADATLMQIGQVYTDSWKMMLKSISIYRDNSKLSQPLNSAAFTEIDEILMLGDENDLDETKGAKEVQEQIITNMYVPLRKRLPKKRKGFVREAYIGNHKVYLRTGEYEDGSLGEIFIDMYKEGAAFRGLLNSFAILASKALQYGIPLDELVDTFTFTRFDPSGIVRGHEAIKSVTSILDYIFRSLGYDYLGRKDFVQVKTVDEAEKNGKHNGNGNGQVPDDEEEPKNMDSLFNGSEKSDEETIEEPNIPTKSARSEATQIRSGQAKLIGYTGETCEYCGSIRVKRNGSCTVCEECGGTSGCS